MIAPRFICHNRYASGTSDYTPDHPGGRRNNGVRWRSGANGKQQYRDHDKGNGFLVHDLLLYLLDSDIKLSDLPSETAGWCAASDIHAS